MKKEISSHSALLFVAVFGLLVFTIASCKKSSTTPAQQFYGTYAGKSTVAGVSTIDTVQITTGTSNSTILVTDQSGLIVNGNVSGNNITVLYQTVYDNYGSGTATGSGSLAAGTTLTFTINDTIGSLGPSILTYTGTKQ